MEEHIKKFYFKHIEFKVPERFPASRKTCPAGSWKSGVQSSAAFENKILIVLQAGRGRKPSQVEVAEKGDEKFYMEFGVGSIICRSVRERAKSSERKRTRTRSPGGTKESRVGRSGHQMLPRI